MKYRSASAEGYPNPTENAAIARAGKTERTTQRLTIPGRLAGYNELTTGHWVVRNGLKRQNMDRVGLAAIKHHIKPIEGKAVVMIVCYEPNKKRDPSNVRAGAEKIILDALQKMKIIHNDNWRWLEDCPTRVCYDKVFPRVEIEIREA